MNREKAKKDSSQETSAGKPTQVPEEIWEAIEAERTGSGRIVDLLPSEKWKMDVQDLNLREVQEM